MKKLNYIIAGCALLATSSCGSNSDNKSLNTSRKKDDKSPGNDKAVELMLDSLDNSPLVSGSSQDSLRAAGTEAPAKGGTQAWSDTLNR